MSALSRDRKFPLEIEALALDEAAEPFSLRLGQSEALSLLSEDAQSLSLFCDVLGGFAQPASGKILLDGQDITREPPERRAIVLVSPREPVFGHLDVAANIALPLRAKGAAAQLVDATVKKMLALVGLDAQMGLPGDQLTPEQRIRLKLARALAGAPSVLILDGLLSALDLRAASKTRDLVSRLQRALGLTLIHAARSREDALWLGGRIALLDGQSLVQCADAATLMERPSDARSARLFGEANLLTGRVLEIEDDVARIHLACGGVVEAMADAELAEDALCILCIRPDRMTPLFGTPMAGDEETPPLLASVQSVLHTGEHIRFRLRLADGAEIEMRRPLLQSLRGVTHGTSLQLAWQASQAVAFPMKDDL
ncbi:ABC transporter ATP-binding protein [Asaia platycodi]|uniref:ABC transporter ATP-binding protein n=1 Tax=Asaia platycodi TaxID=610243 RepID=UPI00046FCEAD|nr:ABC transporter ATP-binding protein [Asaia platycodi]